MNKSASRSITPDMSEAPPESWGSPASTHSVQFYHDDDFLLDDLSRIMGSALGAGDAGVVVATEEHREGLARRLTAQGLNVDLAISQGRYVALDAAETLSMFMVGCEPNPARFHDVIGGVISTARAAGNGGQSRLAVFGEMVALLWAEGNHDAAIALEDLWNELARAYAFDLRCAYSMKAFPEAGDGELLERICSTHSHVVPVESYTSLISEEEKLQAIAFLQQKAQALEGEIEERKRAEQSLRESNHELHRAIAARDEFLSVAAHELKTPITSLGGFAQLLLRNMSAGKEIEPARLESSLRSIESQSVKLARLITRLLDTAQIEAGRLRIEPSGTDIVKLVRLALAPHSSGQNHVFVLDAPDYLEASVDAVRFEQVVTNLLDNAVKYSPEGSTVRVALEKDGAGSIRLSVTDEGIGVPHDQREAIFERFHQAHQEHHLSGMGLGLYISREIVELHGGSIHVEDPGNSGSRFVVTLPPSDGSI